MTATRERIERIADQFNPHGLTNRRKDMVAALTALCEEMEREKWLPIETAPKDVGILVYDPTVENPIASGVVHSRDGYIEAYSMPCGICCNRATHWQPLPQPPAT